MSKAKDVMRKINEVEFPHLPPATVKKSKREALIKAVRSDWNELRGVVNTYGTFLSKVQTATGPTHFYNDFMDFEVVVKAAVDKVAKSFKALEDDQPKYGISF